VHHPTEDKQHASISVLFGEMCPSSSTNDVQGKRSELEMNLFRAPAAARAAKTLDRALFSRTLPTVAASVRENKLISKYRKQLEKTKEVLAVDKFDPIAADPDEEVAGRGGKCLILRPDLKISGKFVLKFCEPCGWTLAFLGGRVIRYNWFQD
jgi:hypothetical protein